MKKLIVMLALFGFIYSQDKVYTFTEEEVTNMANKVKDLQTQVEEQTEQISIYDELMKKYENQAQIDSMLISFKTQQVDILKDREVLYEKQIKLVKPKKSILTNLHTDLDYFEIKKKLPKNITPAYDGLSFEY